MCPPDLIPQKSPPKEAFDHDLVLEVDGIASRRVK